MSQRLYLLLTILVSLTLYKVSAQPTSGSLDDLAYVLESPEDEEIIEQAITDLHKSTGASLKITIIYEADDLENNVQLHHEQWIQAQEKGISWIVKVTRQGKYYQSTQMQVSSGLVHILPDEKQKFIIAEVIEPVFESTPVPEDACVRGLLAGITTLKKLLLQPEAEPSAGNLLASQQQKGNDISDTNILKGSLRNNELLKKLCIEVLDEFESNIDVWLENNNKESLEEVVIPDCLPEDEGKLEMVLERLKNFEENPEELIAVETDEENIEHFKFLVNKLIGKQPPYRGRLTDAEWNELLDIVCSHLLSEEEPIVIKGLSRNADLVVINTITNSFKPDKDRLELTYTVKDTLDLTYSKLEIYHLGKEDTTMATFYTNLAKGEKVEFTDSQDDDKKGWSGKGTDGKFVEAGEYRIKLIAATDESYKNGYEDYEQFEVEDLNAPEFPITADQLEEIFPNTDKERIEEVVTAINKYSNEFGLTTKDKMAHFIAQIGTETAGLEKLSESSNYSAKAIFKTFLKVKRTTSMGASKLTHKYCDLIDGYDCSDCSSCPNLKGYEGPELCSVTPEYYFPTKKVSGKYIPDYETWDANKDVKVSYVKSSTLFDYVYSCRLGNGAKSTKDGSTYKGIGFVHLTGKGTYKQVSEAWNKEYPSDKKEFHGDDIELLKTNIDIAIKASLIYWKMKKINDVIDGNDEDLLEVTAKINLGYYASYVKTTIVNGYDQRKEYYEAAEKAL